MGERADHETSPATPAAASLPWTPALVSLMAGLLLSLFVVAMDTTIVGMALPTIGRELGDFSLYPWIFTGYLLTSTTTVPLWGRCADLLGRRRVLLAGLVIFVAASLLCGAAPTMPLLILFRALQGVGAGCLQPVIFTIVGDTFPTGQRARLQGFFSGVWAVAAIIGPLIGAAFVASIGWRWIFGINLPIGLLAGALMWNFRETRHESGRRGGLDLAGAALLTVGVPVLLWGLGSGSARAQPVWPAAAAGVALLGAFLLLEARVASPTVPLDLLRHPVVGPAIAATILAGALMFGLNAYIPLYVQDALGGSVFAAGAVLAPMSFGWPVGSVVSGRLLMRTGHARLVAAGALALVSGALVLALGPDSAWWAGASCAVVGLGMGLLSTPVLIVVQSSVEWGRRGAATALNQFARTIGGAIGVSLMGVLLQAHVGASGQGARGQVLSEGLHAVFWTLVAVAGAALVTCAAIVLREARRSRGFETP
jgi:EmrB/QacA subfamily drug resistance transporter